MKTKSITIVSDPLITDYGPGRPSVLIAKEFSKRCKVTIITTIISPHIMEALQRDKIQVIDLGINPHFADMSAAYFGCWIREAFISLNSRNLLQDCSVALNFANTLLTPCRAWYAQGPLSVALKAISPSLAPHYRLGYVFLRLLIAKAEDRLMNRFRRVADRVVANSNYTKHLYQQLGIVVDDVIYAPMDLKVFRSTTSNPTRDYVLSYLGKETDLLVLKEVADQGLRLKLFGSKSRNIPKAFLTHSNIEVLGWVDDNELADLYSNASFTLFPFTHEPFGYIPVESMACGTPVLTYNRQGPSESVLHNKTGWLVDNKRQMIATAVKLWHDKDVTEMRGWCRKRAMQFETSTVVRLWERYLQS